MSQVLNNPDELPQAVSVQVPPKEIRTDEKFLSKKCLPVNVVKDKDRIVNIIDELVATGIEHEINCVGLAANQIGYLDRIVIIRLNDGWLPMINPVITVKSKERAQEEEYCLSRPNKPGIRIKRHKWIIVEFAMFNEAGEIVVLKEKIKDRFAARVIQHEVDHLNGRLI